MDHLGDSKNIDIQYLSVFYFIIDMDGAIGEHFARLLVSCLSLFIDDYSVNFLMY